MALSPGDKLICIDARGVKGLTEGETYEFQKDEEGLIRVKATDHGRSEAYLSNRFKKTQQ